MAKAASITYLAYILSRYKINFFSIIPIGLLFLLIFLLAEESSLGIITLLFLSTILMLIARFSSQIASSLLMGVQFIFLLILTIPLYRASQQLGGLLGIGFGESQYKLASQFEPISDFIFLIITEELGFIGAITIIFLFLTYAFTGIRVALKTTDMFGRLLIFGVTGVISLQALLNIGMSLKVIPISETSLPFISYGSTPILVNMFFSGIILNVAKPEAQRIY